MVAESTLVAFGVDIEFGGNGGVRFLVTDFIMSGDERTVVAVEVELVAMGDGEGSVPFGPPPVMKEVEVAPLDEVDLPLRLCTALLANVVEV